MANMAVRRRGLRGFPKWIFDCYQSDRKPAVSPIVSVRLSRSHWAKQFYNSPWARPNRNPARVKFRKKKAVFDGAKFRGKIWTIAAGRMNASIVMRSTM